MIHKGDCLEILKDIPSNSVHAIVTDPPYELGFMGKAWDASGITYRVDLWRECLRVLTPGGHLLAFGGTRTYHRLACAIEDAGFETRDMIEWMYGSGFPKSRNIGKAVDQLQGNEREVVGKGNCGYQVSISKSRLEQGYRPNLTNATTEFNLTKGTSEWEGFGTALKPSHEPICLSRKPLEKGLSVAENCLKWRTGGIDVDGSRVVGKAWKAHNATGLAKNKFFTDGDASIIEKKPHDLGRWPANFIHDGSEEVVALFPESKSTGGKHTNGHNGAMRMGRTSGDGANAGGLGDSGSAARFFYCAKASKAERNRGCEGLEIRQGSKEYRPNDDGSHELMSRLHGATTKGSNHHPTVKPVALMKYLVAMISREGQTVLDPFMGSGTTGIACKMLKREFIGIELDEEYFEIAKRRIEYEKPDVPRWSQRTLLEAQP